MLSLETLQAIELVVARSEKSLVTFGTVTDVITDIDIKVTQDGSAASVPAKAFGDSDIMEGDRVGLVKIGPWIVAFGSFSKRWPGAGGNQNFQSTPGTTTSGSFGDLPTPLSFTFVKRYDTTRVRMNLAVSMFATGGTDGGAVFGLKFSSADYGNVTLDVMAHYINSGLNGFHVHFGGFKYAAGGTWDGAGTLPAGTYTVSAQWARYTGGATLNLNADDRVSIDCIEVGPA